MVSRVSLPDILELHAHVPNEVTVLRLCMSKWDMGQDRIQINQATCTTTCRYRLYHRLSGYTGNIPEVVTDRVLLDAG